MHPCGCRDGTPVSGGADGGLDHFAVNGLGDAAQIYLGHLIEGAIGVCFAGALLIYLNRPTVKAAFS